MTQAIQMNSNKINTKPDKDIDCRDPPDTELLVEVQQLGRGQLLGKLLQVEGRDQVPEKQLLSRVLTELPGMGEAI
jgi:hypothetical protein